MEEGTYSNMASSTFTVELPISSVRSPLQPIKSINNVYVTSLNKGLKTVKIYFRNIKPPDELFQLGDINPHLLLGVVLSKMKCAYKM